jgi:hypothetical protein
MAARRTLCRAGQEAGAHASRRFVMHKHIIHNKCHQTVRDFSDAILTFVREEVPRNWRLYCDDVMDNFRIILRGFSDCGVSGVYQRVNLREALWDTGQRSE